MSGRVQLPRRGVQSLLSTFRRDHLQADMNKAVKQPKNVDDPPEDSDSGEESQHVSPEQNYVDSSDDDVLSGNIQRTIFKSKRDSISASGSDAANGRGFAAKEESFSGVVGIIAKRRSIRQTGAKKRAKDDVEDDDATGNNLFVSKRMKSTSDELAGEVGGHLKTEGLFSKKSAIQRGYGKKSMPQPKFQRRRDFSESISPEKRPKFKSRTFSSLDSSPVAKMDSSLRFQAENRGSLHLSEAPSPEANSDPPRALDGRNKKQQPTRRRLRKKDTTATEFLPEPESQVPEFKMPDGYHNYTPSAELVDVNVGKNDLSVEKRRQIDPGMALCPMCDEQIDKDLLKEFSNGERMKLIQQAKFCRMHKKVSAQKTWAAKGYPVVDWAGLEVRIEAHHDLLKSIIMGSGSHFGDLLQANIRAGHARTLLTTDEYLTPGYYGLRGMSIMTESITGTFSSLLRKRAPVDTSISGRGYTGFVQSVLVPELAVKLIQEDLSLGEDQAREVMEESRVVGEILNDDRRQRRYSKPQACAQTHYQSQSERDGDAVKDHSDRSDADAAVELMLEKVDDGDSDLSSLPSYSPRQTSVKVQSQDANDTDSSDSLELPGTRKMEKDSATDQKHDSSPARRDSEDLAPAMLEVDDSDSDSGSLSSLGSF